MKIHKKKKLIIEQICIFTIICIIAIIVGKVFINLPNDPNKEELVRFFQNNRDTFDKIATYLVGVKGDVSIDKRYGKNIDSIGTINNDGVKSFAIENQVSRDVKKLLYKYKFVAIYEEGQCIYFDKFVGFQWHKSLVYSKEGKAPPLNRERDFAELGDGWFYYEGE